MSAATSSRLLSEVSVELAHHANASRLFADLGGTKATDTVLLESADIASKHSLQTLMVLASSLRLTCHGHQVEVTALSPSGAVIGAHLHQRILAEGGEVVKGEEVSSASNPSWRYTFTPVKVLDERERLTATSTLLPLKLLQHDPELQCFDGRLPLVAGGFAFDYLETFEELPAVEEGESTFPDYQFVLAEIVIRLDHQEGSARLEAVAARDYADEVTARVNGIAAQVAELATRTEDTSTPVKDLSGGVKQFHASMTDEQFRAHVTRLKDNVHSGDLYQAMPSRRFVGTCEDAFAAYEQLKAANPSPYMFYLRGLANGKTFELFGASPESSLKYTASTNQVELYPIAGTMPRGLAADGSIDHELDIRAELALRTDSKELAEHTMLVDLARNDLARVAVPNTRKVAELLKVDRYSRVMHLVSRVVAELDPRLDALDAYRACMNMGTLTGAPKIKAVELLRKVEKTRRGSYGGAVGYMRGNGDMDTCIVIRSAYVTDGKVMVQAGAGVVRDSVPQREADESLHKAWAVLAALSAAENKTVEVIR